MINEELFLRIKNLSHLTKGEASIVQYFKLTRTELAMVSINSISKGAKVSKATVTRFVKKLGYKDFAQFKAGLRRELFSKLDSPYLRYQAQKTIKDVKKQGTWSLNVEGTIRDLRKTQTLNSDEKISRAAEMLSLNKGRLFIVGLMGSYGIAHYFWQYLHFIKPAVLLDNNSGNLSYQLLDINENDVLFAISYIGYSKQTTLTMTHFYKRGAKVVLLTDSETSPPVQWSHLQLIAPTQWETLLMSRCSCLMVVEGLLAAMTLVLGDQSQKQVKKIRQLSDEFDVFTVKQSDPPQATKETKSPKKEN